MTLTRRSNAAAIRTDCSSIRGDPSYIRMEFASTLTETVRFRAQVVRMLADRLPTVPESSSIQTYLPSIVTESSLTEPDIARGLILSGWTAAVPVRTDPPSARMEPS